METRQGRLEVLGSPGSWFSVCAAGFSNATANIICSEMGHTSGFYRNYTATKLQLRWLGSGNVTCPADGEFRQCVVKGTAASVCPDASYVSLFCFDVDSPKEREREGLREGGALVSKAWCV